jgi:GMP synthase-like glutamine amidotransferase
VRRIAILEAGFPPRALQPRFGAYSDMFESLLGRDAFGPVYDVTHGHYPADVRDHDTYLITGSSAGVYDDLPWIAPLKAFLTGAKGKAKLVGICFGHQIMAEAFGGHVVKSDKGWGIGLHHYQLSGAAEWMTGPREVAIPVCHQDQVVVQPPHTRLLGGNDFCPLGILAYDDQAAFSVQFHPEFDPAFAAALIDLVEDEVKPAKAEAARASLDAPNDRQRAADWIRAFASV